MDAKQRLNRLAEACWNGACNPRGILRSLAEAVAEDGDLVRTAAYRIVLGQLSSLAGESLGPSDDAVRAWRADENEGDV